MPALLGLFFAAKHIQLGEDDDDADVILAIALFANFVGWIVGVLIGTLTTKLSSSRQPREDQR